MMSGLRFGNGIILTKKDVININKIDITKVNHDSSLYSRSNQRISPEKLGPGDFFEFNGKKYFVLQKPVSSNGLKVIKIDSDSFEMKLKIVNTKALYS